LPPRAPLPPPPAGGAVEHALPPPGRPAPRRRRAEAFRKIFKRSRRHEKQRDDPAVEHEGKRQQPFHRAHDSLIVRLFYTHASKPTVAPGTARFGGEGWMPFRR